jgi:hypothetical protein
MKTSMSWTMAAAALAAATSATAQVYREEVRLAFYIGDQKLAPGAYGSSPQLERPPTFGASQWVV